MSNTQVFDVQEFIEAKVECFYYKMYPQIM
jgi:hypothetical protein